jgi:hypothetical protein
MITIQLDGDWETREVYLNGTHLSPKRSLAVKNHSPDGFSWGYSGSGPAQLALAVCLAVIGKDVNYQKFKFDHIAKLPQSDFDVEITFNPEDYKR